MRAKALVILVASAFAAVLTSTAAHADQTCVPITVDGQPVFCADLTPVTDTVDSVVGTVQTTAQQYEAIAANCVADEPDIFGVVVPSVATDSCDEFYVTSDPYLEMLIQGPGITEPVHVPQVCVVTTGTCAGPYDTTITVPVTPYALHMCLVDGHWDASQPRAATYSESQVICWDVPTP